MCGFDVRFPFQLFSFSPFQHFNFSAPQSRIRVNLTKTWCCVVPCEYFFGILGPTCPTENSLVRSAREHARSSYALKVHFKVRVPRDLEMHLQRIRICNSFPGTSYQAIFSWARWPIEESAQHEGITYCMSTTFTLG